VRELLNVSVGGIRLATRAAWGLILPRVMGVDDFGTYVLIQGTAMILSSGALLGSPMSALSGRTNMPVLFGHTFALGLLLAAGAWAFMDNRDLLLFIVIAVQLFSFDDLLSAWARGRGAFRELLAAYAGGYGVFAAAAVVLLLTPGPLTAPPALWIGLVAPAIVIATLALLVPRRTVASQPVLPWREALKPVYTIGGLVVIDIIIWRRVEIFFLNESPAGPAGVAVFGLAIQLATLALFVPAAVLESWFPQVTAAWHGDGEAYHAMIRRRLRQYLLILGGMSFAALAGYALFLPWVYPKYTEWYVLILLIIAIRLVVATAGFFSFVLYATGRGARLYAPVLTGAAVALAANLLLTLPYGLAGLPIAYALTHIVTAIGAYWAYRRSRDVPPGAAADGSGEMPVGLPIEEEARP
jgi:O-antigen/teichoic acid export membrane protein